jgi:catechol 2,3-dioxygenase-like lactoylglutathione lyase family enzyme
VTAASPLTTQSTCSTIRRYSTEWEWQADRGVLLVPQKPHSLLISAPEAFTSREALSRHRRCKFDWLGAFILRGAVMIRSVLAQCTVSDLERAEQWYTRLFNGPPDARPMPGLLEWHLGDAFGVQVWLETDRAGQSTVVLGETDLDRAAARLSAAGVDHAGPEPGGGARLLQLADPDGNRIVFTGA